MKRRDKNADATSRSRGSAPHRWRRLAAAITTAAAVVGGSLVVAASAQAATHTFFVDSLDGSASAAGVNVGNGVCETTAGTCTMRAAIEEANALNLPKGSVTITVADGLTGNIDALNAAAARMQNSRVSNQDAAAHFEITAPVIIDLDNRVTMQTSADTAAALFHVNGPDVEFRNMRQILSGETSIVTGPQTRGFLLDGGETSTERNYFPERFMVIREGASDITVRNYRIQGFYHAANATGIFYVNAQNNTPIRNVRIENVQIAYPTATTCNASNGSGCRTDIVQFLPRNRNVVLDGFTFTNSFVSNLTNRDAFPFSRGTAATSVTASNIDISNNSFINAQGSGTGVNNAFITLPFGPMAGENRIVGNEFVRATSGQTFAISWNGTTTSGSAGNLRIAENYFDGYSATSVSLTNTGDVTVEKNTFGARSASQARPAITEETRTAATTLVVNNTNANGQIGTWFPTSDAAVLTGAAPSGLIPTVSPLGDGVPVCLATLEVSAPTSSNIPAGPVDLDAYWTGDRTAEVYLGRAEAVTGGSAQIELRLPVGPQTFPTTEVGGSQQVTIVDDQTGAASGYIRLQTRSVTGQTSQYSRIVGFSGNCMPALTIEQAEGQNDPTLARDLHFTVTSSLPLDPASVSAASLDLAASPVDETIDAERLNPRVTSVTAVDGSENREFLVVARVDDSARVEAAIPAERVTSVGGLPNHAAATGEDDAIVFINPIAVRPSDFTLVTGDPTGQQYVFDLRVGAPAVASPLLFSSELDQDGVNHGVSISQTDPTIAVGEARSEAVRVVAEAGDVAANTPVSITTTLRSEDANYDQLVVQPVTVRLFSTDPAIRIDKRAFVDVTDTSSPEAIMATGTEAFSGTRLTDGQAVCFVYTVTNISSDDWTTVLADVVVTDTDRRLGDDGVIGTIGKIEIGQSARLSACTSLIPIDTTVGGLS
ncbi:hypothetical protein PUW81_007585 [Microbacterium sp. NM3R9]|uniref:hypothetical protein n=2 Tax=Microbacterium thalli TaxID=3027921 RepID=UPI0023662955|nr:hypothetical protein [Microbacterium thalli]MDN8548965.1 hypothetical protein [Microbacterium thalli]